MEAEAEGRPAGPPEFVANFLRKCYPIKYVLTIDPVERLGRLGTKVSRRDTLAALNMGFKTVQLN